MHRRFVRSAAPRPVAQPVDLAQITGRDQHLSALAQHSRRFRLVGLGNQRHLAIRGQAVDASIAVGREQDLPVRRTRPRANAWGYGKQIVDVLLLRAPQCFHAVVGIDPVQRRFFHTRQVEDRSVGNGSGRDRRRLNRFRLRRLYVRARLCIGGHRNGGDRRRSGRASGLRGLRGSLRALGDRASQCRRVNGSIRRGDDGADLRQVGVIQHEGFVLRADAVQDAVRLAPGQQPPFAVESQAGHVRLPGLIIHFALAGGGHAKDLALVARAHVERAIRPHRQRPDVASARPEVFAGFALRDAVDLSIRRRARVERAGRVDGQSEDLRLLGRPQELRCPALIDLVQLAPVSGGRIHNTLAALRQAPYDRLVGGEQRVDLGRDRQPAVARQGQPLEPASDEVLVIVHLPRRGSGREQDGRHGQQSASVEDSHSLMSTWIVFDPVTTEPMPSISSSASLELKVCESPP